MTITNARVAIVVDRNFGDKLVSLADQMPVWIVDTPVNRAAAESFWCQTAEEVRSLVTTFSVDGNDASAWCCAILPQVDLHHGEYSQSPTYDSVEVFGTSATAELRDAFSEYGFTISFERADGFRAVR